MITKIDATHLKKILKFTLVVFSYMLYIGVAAFLLLNYFKLQKKTINVENSLTNLIQDQKNFKSNFEEELFNEHLQLMDKFKIQSELDTLSVEFEKLSSLNQGTTAVKINQIYSLYQDFEAKLNRNKGVKIDSTSAQSTAETWGDLLISQKFDELKTQIIDQNTALDSSYDKYLDSLPKQVPVVAGSGYSYNNITTERGTTHGVYLIKVPLSSVKVKTLAAIEDDCDNNCPAKPLAQYVTENNGFAGMNGSYNCPPDYPACAGKTNSFDYAFYDSNDKKWFNKDARTWSDTGMFTFKGNSYSFYKKSSEYGGDSVDAAISNYPSLLKNSEVVVDEGKLSSYQKTKGLRGAIGVGGENIYLAIINNATVTDTAYVMKALGAKHALNLDGGGSAALFINGSYVVGPGRQLSNAIVLVK